LLTETDDGRGGQTLAVEHEGVDCRLFAAPDDGSRESRRQVERGTHVFFFAADAPLTPEHTIEYVDERSVTRRFEVTGMQGRTSHAAYIRAQVQEVTE
jgi:hypothetical protein